jgi:hypothetical protein
MFMGRSSREAASLSSMMLSHTVGFSADCFTNREAPFSDGPQERIRNATIYRCRLGIEARSRAPAFFGTLKSNRPTFTRRIDSYMSSSDKLKLPEIRFLTPEEDQQLTDLAEDMAQRVLGPDWKERQEQRRAAREDQRNSNSD